MSFGLWDSLAHSHVDNQGEAVVDRKSPRCGIIKQWRGKNNMKPQCVRQSVYLLAKALAYGPHDRTVTKLFLTTGAPCCIGGSAVFLNWEKPPELSSPVHSSKAKEYQ